MKNGYRVVDVDTHVSPKAEVLDMYVSPEFRPKLEELKPQLPADTYTRLKPFIEKKAAEEK